MAKPPIDLNWSNLIENGPPAEVEIIPSGISSQRENVEHLSDQQLDEKIQRMQTNMNLIARLNDRGAKYMTNLKQLLTEKERRKTVQLQKDANDSQKPILSKSSCVSGESHTISQKPSMSSSPFAECFSKQLDNRSGGCTPSAFNGNQRHFVENMCNNGKINGHLTSLERQGIGISSKTEPFRCPTCLSAERERGGPLIGNPKGTSPTSHSPLHLEENLFSHISNKRASSPTPTSCSVKTRKVQTLVVLDEEEARPISPEQSVQQEDKIEEWTKDVRIYYPSRDDPESIELCGIDLQCLNPGCPLSSPIMNFYIRYLQRPISPTGKPRGDYHFFNTYFYKKLENAVSNKGGDSDTSYAKFQKWWKGINIFQKAYIFLPIHADEHWSLAIICMPAKDEDSGPLVLHLDSLGFHPSSRIFENIESYLRREWNYLKQSMDPQHVPISKRIWNRLSRRILREVITVPQQKNEYDCGIFVLYFIERFIEEAPERLTKKDLSMFGRNWFKPEEASKLRERINFLLREQFESARLENGSIASSSSDGDGSCQKQ